MRFSYIFVISVSLVLLNWPQHVYSQTVSIGYRSHFGGMESYKNVVNFYNDNRPWLDNKFSSTGYMHGIELGLGASTEDFGISVMRFYFNFAKTHSKGTFNNVSYKRTLRNRIFGLELFDFWITPIHLGDFNLGFGVMPIGLGIYRTKTWLKGEKTENIPLSDLEKLNLEIVKSFHAYVSPHIDFSYVNSKDKAINLQFFYTIGPKQEYELYYLNQELNPNTYTQINQRTLLKINNFGVKLMFNL